MGNEHTLDHTILYSNRVIPGVTLHPGFPGTSQFMHAVLKELINGVFFHLLWMINYRVHPTHKKAMNKKF